jgi:hypothetical protein
MHSTMIRLAVVVSRPASRPDISTLYVRVMVMGAVADLERLPERPLLEEASRKRDRALRLIVKRQSMNFDRRERASSRYKESVRIYCGMTVSGWLGTGRCKHTLSVYDKNGDPKTIPRHGTPEHYK